MVNCRHFTDAGGGIAICRAGHYSGRTTHGTCLRHCPWRVPTEGTGVTPATVTVTAPPLAAVPRSEWPLAAKMLASLAQSGDTGLGDIAARLAKLAGAQTLAAWFKDLTGRDCGCADRQRKLNQLYPL